MLEGDRGVEVQQRLLRILSRLREQEDKETVLNVLHNYMQILSQPAKRELIKQVYAVPFSSDILDADLLAEAWEKGALGLSYDISNLERNVTTISILREQYGPEVLEKIHSNYGVCHFGRYPIEVFHRFLNRDPAAPTVTLIYPYADRAGVFYEDEETFAELLGASQKLNFNIIEAGNGIDVYLRMKLLKSEYPETDLDVVLVGGHGETDLLELGTQDMGESSVITKQMLSPAVLRLINRLLDENTTLIFCACNVGSEIDEGSFAKHVFDGTKCKKVIAATNPISGLRNFRLVKHKSNKQPLEVDTDFAKSQGLGVVRKKVYSR